MEWRSITGYPHYEVSPCGQVRSTDRIVYAGNGRQRRHKGKVLKPYLQTRGYHVVSLGIGNKSTVHRLVAEAYLGLDRSDRTVVVDHLDGDKINNHVDNLRVVSQRVNLNHGGPAYRVLCSLVGQPEADRLIADHVSN